jgi:membrane-bound lytic murein transglycosylase D
MILLAVASLAACSHVPERVASAPPEVADSPPAVSSKRVQPPAPAPPAAARLSEVPDLWTRFAAGRALRTCTSADRVAYWMDRYGGNRERFANQLAELMPRMDYVLRQAESLGLPAEVMLVPYIESHYRTDARGPGGAYGMWQLMPDTATRFGLSRPRDGVDERADLHQSTQAALRVLAHHHKDFSGHAPLMFAAYNAGGYRVRKLLAGRSTDSVGDLRSLALPRTTREYLAKLQALSCLIGDAGRFDVVLPVDDRRLHLAEWRAPLDIDPLALARAAELDPAGVTRSNRSAFKRGRLPAGGVLLVPEEALPALESIAADGHLARLGPGKQAPPTAVTVDGDVHRVSSGDSLWNIARRYRVALADLMRWNRLNEHSVLRIGQELRLAEP